MQPNQFIVPEINAQELKEFIETLLPQAQVTFSPMNPDYGSWRIEVEEWEPLSGFGFTDLNEELEENDNPFDPYGVNLQSMEAAKDCLKQLNAH